MLKLTIDLSPPTLSIQSNTATTNSTSTANASITHTCGDATSRGLIYYEYSNTDKSIGDASVTNVSETGSFGTGAFTASFTGLTPNTRYNTRAHATNSYGIDYSSRSDFRTLANVPSAPSVSNPTPSTLDISVNVNSNPASTEFAIQDTVNGKYLQANGMRANTIVWQTATSWGTTIITGLTSGTTYIFRVKSRNGDNVETVYGPSESGMPVDKPTLTIESATSITSVSTTGNGTITLTNGANATSRGLIYYEYSNTDMLIGNTGVTNVSETGSYGTGVFTASFTGLTPNTRYNTRAHATNPYGTAYSSRTDFRTLANVPSAPIVNNPTATSLDVAVVVNSNPSTTEFAIQDSINGYFVQISGLMGVSEVWQTAANWGTKTVSGLSTGVTYYFRVKARNGDDVETAYSLTTAQNTCSNPTTAGSIAASQTICYSTAATALSSVSLPTNYGGTLE